MNYILIYELLFGIKLIFYYKLTHIFLLAAAEQFSGKQHNFVIFQLCNFGQQDTRKSEL